MSCRKKCFDFLVYWLAVLYKLMTINIHRGQILPVSLKLDQYSGRSSNTSENGREFSTRTIQS